MKATGITRRIDDLGRVVIPKEIRKNLKLTDGDALEIFIDKDQIILQRHKETNIDWEFIGNTLYNLYHSKTNLALYDKDFRRQYSTFTFGSFPPNGADIDAEFIRTILLDGEHLCGYIAFDNDEFEQSSEAVAVAGAMINAMEEV